MKKKIYKNTTIKHLYILIIAMAVHGLSNSCTLCLGTQPTAQGLHVDLWYLQICAPEPKRQREKIHCTGLY